jgi:hypothetical protein
MAPDPSSRAPSEGDLRWFGAILLAFFGLVGAVVGWQSGSLRAAAILWGLGAGLALLYTAIRPLRQPLYRLWMAAVLPIGWLVSNLLLGAVFYLVITPIGLLARAFGRDPLTRRFEPDADSYWIEDDPGGEPGRYYRQS